MWNNKQASNPPGTSAGTGVTTLPNPYQRPHPYMLPQSLLLRILWNLTHSWNATRAPSWLGPGLTIKGQIPAPRIFRWSVTSTDRSRWANTA